MPVSLGSFKAGRVVLAGCIGLAGLVAIAGTASAQVPGQREKLRTPTENNFLNPGRSASNMKSPGYVVDGLITAPGARNDRLNSSLLPPMIGGGSSLVNHR